MLRRSILTCLLVAVSSTANAKGAADPSTEDAPFAGDKTPAPFATSPSAGFAPVGQWVLTLRTTGDGGYFFFHNDSPGDWAISLHPALDYFIINSVSIGGTVGIRYSPADAGTTVLDIGARAGFNLTMTDHLSLWPTAGVAAHHQNIMHVSNTSTAFAVFAPFLYHPVPHLFLGAGPSFSVLMSGGSGKTYGVDFVLGGWL